MSLVRKETEFGGSISLIRPVDSFSHHTFTSCLHSSACLNIKIHNIIITTILQSDDKKVK